MRLIKRGFNKVSSRMTVIILIAWLVSIGTMGFCYGQQKDTPDNPDPGIHYVIGYDCSGTMVLEKKEKKVFLGRYRGKKRYKTVRPYLENYEKILTKVNSRILELLKKDFSPKDRITIAYLGLNTAAVYNQAIRNGSKDYFCDKLVYITPKSPFQSLDDLESILEDLIGKMSSKSFRREFSFPTVQKQALMKLAAPKYQGSHTRVIWVTDGVTNVESNEFTSEIEKLERNKLENVIELRDDIEKYYNFKSITTERVNHIQLLYYDVGPDDPNIRIIYKEKNGRTFDGFKKKHSTISSSFDPIKLQAAWKDNADISFVSGYYTYSGSNIKQELNSPDFTIEPNKVAKELNYPDYSQLFIRLRFKDKYGNSFIAEPGPYSIGFQYDSFPKTAIIWTLVGLLVIIFLLFFLKSTIKIITTMRKATPLPIKGITASKKVKCQAITGKLDLTSTVCLLHLRELKRLPKEKSMKVMVEITGECQEPSHWWKIEKDKPVVFFDNKETTKEFELRNEEKDCRIPFLVNIYCQDKIPIDITLKIIDIPEEYKEYYTQDTRPFADDFVLRPNPDDPIKVWKWDFAKVGDVDSPVSVKKENNETLLGRIKFTKSADLGDIEADDEELSQLIDNLSFHVENPVCYEVESGTKVGSGTDDDIDKDDIFFKSFDPSIRNVGIYSQIYLKSKKVDIKKKSELSFQVRVECKDEIGEDEKSEDEEKIKLAKDAEAYRITIAPDYGDLHIAVDFGTTATTCVFGRPMGADLSGRRAVLETDESGNPRYMIDSILVVDISSGPANPKVVVGQDAHAYHSPGENYKVFRSFKTLIGKKELNINGHMVEIRDIMVGIYQDLYRRLCIYNQEHIKREEIRRLAVSVPNSYPPNKIKMVRDAWAQVKAYEDDECKTIIDDKDVFEKDNISIIQEAEATVLLYAEVADIGEGTKRILASDNGGGTLDLGLVEISRIHDQNGNSKLKTELIQKCGYKLGGDTLDQIFAKFIYGFYALKFTDKKISEDVLFAPSCSDSKIKSLRVELKNLAKKVKEFYSSESISATIESLSDIVTINYQDIIKSLNTESEDKVLKEFMASVNDYHLKAVVEALNDLLSGNPINPSGKKIDEIIYTGRGGLFKGLKDRFILDLRDREVLKEDRTDPYPLENIFNRIAGNEDFSEEEMLKYCVAYGALCYSWKKERELILSTPKNYGTYFIVQDYDKEMEHRLKEENNGVIIDKDKDIRGKVFIPLIKNGEKYKKDKKSNWWYVTGETKYAKATAGNCDIFYGQGTDFAKDYKDRKYYKYERVIQIPGSANYCPLKMTLYYDDNDSSWTITYDGAVVEDSDKDVIKLYVPLSDDDFQKYWPYTKEELTHEK